MRIKCNTFAAAAYVLSPSQLYNKYRQQTIQKKNIDDDEKANYISIKIYYLTFSGP